MAQNEGKSKRQEFNCCAVMEEAAMRSRERRAKRKQKPMPWIVLKLAVGITIGIVAYTFYVYIGRLCVPMIRKNEGALGGRGTGIAFLVVFCVLGLMMLWAYEKVVMTSPGLARDFVKQAPEPVVNSFVPAWWDSQRDLTGMPYQYTGQGEQPPESTATDLPNGPQTANGHHANGDLQAGMTDAIPAVAQARVAKPNAPVPQENGSARKVPQNTRRVPESPVLRPENRYCWKEGFVKPLRAHHCAACGTCVLRYDHHCPWIGQCVGARNYKFFVIFLEWALLFCSWTFSTLVADQAKSGHVDPEKIVIIVLSAFFVLFTVSLLLSQARLIMLNTTTVESLRGQSVRDREKRVLARMHPWYALGAKRRTRQQWDQEWGRIDYEGNLWWLGSHRANWESVMGTHVWQWFLPIGRSPDDGLSYTPNPRHDPEGRWRPRREWPAELQ
ncbi:DHHC palmitoyltransferase-domain-containing protein [Fomitopsis serialis]|uniref:DHHC palmitoyltransferase-domain-containing protein n=1 Tax=Fomitopsis serialis TaxID=139415 RepID=UPI002008E5F2|nr:DHHC palmitoyltransferase-domain-containing protein [Neoantrodia serialis]KAH9922222.1 DHHC palmitoyltransferase-domain-containing protein [Neoantrodia serialis]